MTEAQIVRGWHKDADYLLSALHTVFSYTDREPCRATGWLYLPQEGKVWPDVFSNIGPQLFSGLLAATGTRFTAACFQAYLNGSGCDWHYDRDWDAQAIISLGVTRSFGLRRNGGEELFMSLHHGDLLVMPPGFQHEWEHCVPEEESEGERCSLVFRSPASGLGAEHADQ